VTHAVSNMELFAVHVAVVTKLASPAAFVTPVTIWGAAFVRVNVTCIVALATATPAPVRKEITATPRRVVEVG
jgi:hypothetical protein